MAHMTADPHSAEHAKRRIMVIGVGNPHRGDDSVGLLVAQGVRDRLTSRVKVIEITGGLTSLLDTWQTTDSVILVDASVSQGNPGDIQRFEPVQKPLPTGATFTSTHGIGVVETIGLAQALGRLPERFLVYAIEGRCFEPGNEMSPEVRAASDTVTDEIVAHVRLWERDILTGRDT